MSIESIAKDFADFCRKGIFGEDLEKYYHEDATSVEPGEESAQGLNAIIAKKKAFIESIDLKLIEVKDPQIAQDHFSIAMRLEVEDKSSGAKRVIDELAVYEVKDNKITFEQFFYLSK